MAQHDYTIADQDGLSFLSDLNTMAEAIVTNNSGPTAPSVMYANMFWADTSSGKLKKRNAANTAWVEIGGLDSAAFGGIPSTGGTSTGPFVMSAAPIVETEGAPVTAAATCDIWAPNDGNSRHVAGNVTITSFGTAPQAGAWMKLIFDGTPQLTQSANLNLNANGLNVVMEAGDLAFVYADTTTQFDVFIIRKSGKPIVGGSGTVHQIVTFVTGAVATGNTAIPNDDTIPQITEGDQYLSIALTPIDAASMIELDVTVTVACNSSTYIIIALFQSGVANALATAVLVPYVVNTTGTCSFKCLVPAGSTSARNYSVRMGTGGGNTLTLNGFSGGRYLGGSLGSRITAKEYIA